MNAACPHRAEAATGARKAPSARILRTQTSRATVRLTGPSKSLEGDLDRRRRVGRREEHEVAVPELEVPVVADREARAVRKLVEVDRELDLAVAARILDQVREADLGSTQAEGVIRNHCILKISYILKFTSQIDQAVLN